MKDPFEQDRGLVRFQLEAARGIAEIPVLDKDTIETCVLVIASTMLAINKNFLNSIAKYEEIMRDPDMSPGARNDAARKILDLKKQRDSLVEQAPLSRLLDSI